ncbi:centrosomal protein of 112 kDa-like [Polypterus senegalus]|uniref:centrosomal protein of 112 kDa-like n=1 Tax=Polypterus senegalus TaxID=55291 RepID=UPI001965CCC1|nr:centrosomal protein of 112 kDa-like [Polypterus senegalus]
MMNRQEESWEKLDLELDHYMVDMKRYFNKLSNKSEQQRCTLWIKKLCECCGPDSGVLDRKNRNLYARLLLLMLQRGQLESPFTARPKPGPLERLPAYKSIYFDVPMHTGAAQQDRADLTDWEMGETDTRPKDLLAEFSSPLSPLSRRRRAHSEKLPVQPRTFTSERRPIDGNQITFKSNDRRKDILSSSDDSDVETRLNSWNLGIENPRYLRENPIGLSPISMRTSLGKMSTFCEDPSSFHIQDKEIEMNTKLLEAKFHEEKLKLEQKHDADVKKIIDRKNSEIEALKNYYRTKQAEAEETNKSLEKRIKSLVQESKVFRESKDQQISELKKIADESVDSVKNEWEKKLHNAVTKLEMERFDLQKKHAENIHELLEDTNSRLSRMEAEHAAQTKATDLIVKELEARVQQLTVEVENGNLLRQKLTQEKAELEILHRTGVAELTQMKERCSELQKEKENLSEEYEMNIQAMQVKQASDITFLKQEYTLSAGKSAELIDTLEQAMTELKQKVQEAEQRRLQQLKEQEMCFQKEKANLELLNETKIQSLQIEAEKERENSRKMINSLEESLREKEEQFQREAQQTEATIEQFRKQMQQNTEKVYAEMKQQMAKVEADLSRSKSLREKQSKEFDKQLEDQRQRYEQQITELKVNQEHEKSEYFQKHNAVKDLLVQGHEQEIEKLEKEQRAVMAQHEEQMQEWRQRSNQTIAELKGQVHQLREEMFQEKSQSKQQLRELSRQHEEERQKTAKEHEATIKKLERTRLDLQQTHALEIEQALDKANNRIKEVERESGQKLVRSSETIAELQTALASALEDLSRQQMSAEQRFHEAKKQFDAEKKQFQREHEKKSKGEWVRQLVRCQPPLYKAGQVEWSHPPLAEEPNSNRGRSRPLDDAACFSSIDGVAQVEKSAMLVQKCQMPGQDTKTEEVEKPLGAAVHLKYSSPNGRLTGPSSKPPDNSISPAYPDQPDANLHTGPGSNSM